MLASITPLFTRLMNKLAGADGLIIATPVYKASFSGALQDAAAILLPERALEGKNRSAAGYRRDHRAYTLAVDYALNRLLNALKAQEILHTAFC